VVEAVVGEVVIAAALIRTQHRQLVVPAPSVITGWPGWT
jgi:hypothetical protein